MEASNFVSELERIIQSQAELDIKEFAMRLNEDAQPNPIAAIVRGLDLLAAQMPQGIRYRIEYDPTRGNHVQLYCIFEANGEKYWIAQAFDALGSFDVPSDLEVSHALERIRAHYTEILDNLPTSKTD